MTDDIDFTEIVDRHFSIDGPHDADTIVAALRSAAGLLRYVAHATYPGKKHLPYGPQVNRAVGAFDSVIGAATQIAQQIGGVAADLADDPTMYDDRYTSPHAAQSTALEAAVVLQDEVGSALADASRRLREAHSLTGHLGHNVS